MKPKFKIGDKVKIANNSRGSECHGLGDSYLNDTGVITRISREEHVIVRFDKDNTEHGCFYIGQLELVSSEEPKRDEQPRFKVGDRVRVLDTENIKRWRVMWGHVGSPVGHVATITFVSEEGNKFILDSNKWGTNFLASDLEPVADERIELEEMVDRVNKGMEEISSSFYIPFPPPMYHKSWDVGPGESLTGLQEHANQKSKSLMSKAVEFVKNKALQVSNPDEYELRKAGLHDEDGDLTEDGLALQNEFLRELVKKQMVESAKAINAEKKEKCA